MKKTKFTEEQIAFALARPRPGGSVKFVSHIWSAPFL